MFSSGQTIKRHVGIGIVICYTLSYAGHLVGAAELLIKNGIVQEYGNFDFETCVRLSQPQKNGLLQEAVEKGDYFTAQLVLQSRASVNMKDENGSELIHKATQRQDNEITQLLLLYKASIDAKDKDGKTPMHIAARLQSLETAQALCFFNANINAADNYGFKPLEHLIAYGNEPHLRTFLCNYGAQISSKKRIRAGHIQVAAFLNKCDLVQCYLDSGININAQRKKDRSTPLHAAVVGNQLEAVDFLLDCNANIYIPMRDGMTSFHIAAFSGYAPILDLLLQRERSLFKPMHEYEKIAFLAAMFESEQAAMFESEEIVDTKNIVFCIAAYKGLEQDVAAKNSLFQFRKGQSEAIDAICPSILSRDRKGETAREYALQALDEEEDPIKQSDLKLCIALLDHQEIRMIRKLVRLAFEAYE